jgi:hypothetical protein
MPITLMPGPERHLKDVFKDVARNSQQRGQDTFLCQVGAHIHEKLMMTKAKQFSSQQSLPDQCQQ